MNGTYLAVLILAINILAAGSFAADQHWPKFLYFAGASILTLGVILMD
jgi:hypothetical protein